MSKAPVDIIKYVIHAEAEATGLVEKPDLIGAIFGQTEGLLGEDLDLRELQKSGRIGRIDATMDTKGGITKAHVTIPSSLDMVETSIIAAGVETITRVGPCDAKFNITNIEDVREDKRKAVVDRARQLLKTFMADEMPDSKEISEELREGIRTDNITTLKGLDAGPECENGKEIIIVEGRADVLNLLRNGIKNSIAVGGIKIPAEIVDITKGKEVTVFVDGDRGGDLILKSLKNAGVKVDHVSKAPTGREVEGLARKEIIMSLRRKKDAEEVLKEIDDDSAKDEKGKEPRRSREQPPSRGRSSDRRESRPERSDRRDSRPERSERRDSGRDSRDRREPRERRESRDRPSRTPRHEEPVRSSEGDKLLEKLGTIKNQALILDDKFEELAKVDIVSLKKAKELKKAAAIVIDDIVTNELLELAKGCKYVVGITTAGNLKPPKDKVIVTKF
jgi:DNA primase